MDNLDRGVDGCTSSIIDLRWVVNDWSRGVNSSWRGGNRDSIYLRGVVDDCSRGVNNLWRGSSRASIVVGWSINLTSSANRLR